MAQMHPQRASPCVAMIILVAKVPTKLYLVARVYSLAITVHPGVVSMTTPLSYAALCFSKGVCVPHLMMP